MKKIGVVFGGRSPEHEVSLESAYSVLSNINTKKYEVIPIGITKKGDWFYYTGPIEKIKENTWQEPEYCEKVTLSTNRSDKGIINLKTNEVITLDGIFPVLHGSNGEDGTLQGLIELAGIPLIGCSVLSSSLCMDKYVSHKLVESYGIKVAKSIVVKHMEDWNESTRELSFPVFVKPVKAGSSFGITKVEKEAELERAIENAFQYDNEVIVEEAIEGMEVGCAVLGQEELFIGEVDEIELSQGFFDYTEKYTLKTSSIHVPARIQPEVANKIKNTAKQIYQILKCKDFARVDMFLTKTGDIYFNEVNTIPGFTSHSRYPNMMKAAGIRFEELIERLIGLEVK